MSGTRPASNPFFGHRPQIVGLRASHRAPRYYAPARREPDDSRVFALLQKLGLEPVDAYAFVPDLQHMAAENLIVRF